MINKTTTSQATRPLSHISDTPALTTATHLTPSALSYGGISSYALDVFSFENEHHLTSALANLTGDLPGPSGASVSQNVPPSIAGASGQVTTSSDLPFGGLLSSSLELLTPDVQQLIESEVSGLPQGYQEPPAASTNTTTTTTNTITTTTSGANVAGPSHANQESFEGTSIDMYRDKASATSNSTSRHESSLKSTMAFVGFGSKNGALTSKYLLVLKGYLAQDQNLAPDDKAGKNKIVNDIKVLHRAACNCRIYRRGKSQISTECKLLTAEILRLCDYKPSSKLQNPPPTKPF